MSKERKSSEKSRAATAVRLSREPRVTKEREKPPKAVLREKEEKEGVTSSQSPYILYPFPRSILLAHLINFPPSEKSPYSSCISIFISSDHSIRHRHGSVLFCSVMTSSYSFLISKPKMGYFFVFLIRGCWHCKISQNALDSSHDNSYLSRCRGVVS